MRVTSASLPVLRLHQWGPLYGRDYRLLGLPLHHIVPPQGALQFSEEMQDWLIGSQLSPWQQVISDMFCCQLQQYCKLGGNTQEVYVCKMLNKVTVYGMQLDKKWVFQKDNTSTIKYCCMWCELNYVQNCLNKNRPVSVWLIKIKLCLGACGPLVSSCLLAWQALTH